MKNLIEDAAMLTCIAVDDLKKLNNICESMISHYIVENMLEKESITKIDIGLGTLSIKQDTQGIKYKFIPSDSLESLVETTYATKKSSLKQKIEKALGSRLTKTYKDLL